MTPAPNTIRISKPDLFSFSECLHFLDRGYDDCLYSIDGGKVRKALYLSGEPSLIQVSEDSDSLVVEVLAGGSSRTSLKQAGDFVIEWFDMERDLRPFYRLLDQHSAVAFMGRQYTGLRLMGIPGLFEALCWCVIGQQINLSFAHRLKRRLVETYGTCLPFDSASYYHFPKPKQLAAATVEGLREMQFSRQKAEYIIGIAKEFTEGNLSKKALAECSETDAMLKRLMSIRGVGEWTANYVLMKSLKRMDCITYGDTGLQSALSDLLGLSRKPARAEVEAFFATFRGWESYLVIYLWRSLS